MTAELVVKIGRLHSQIEEASAKGFRNKAAMDLLYSLETTVDALLSMATAEYLDGREVQS